jgi:predicted Rossmann fold flavoprotein
MNFYDTAIIGAGAAGLFCAGVAARRGRRVVVIDQAAEPGRKILISGGGRCNFTNREVAPGHFISGNRHFCKSALAGFTTQDFIDLVVAHGIAFHEKTLGQLFCDGSAREILAMLLGMCGAELKLGCKISNISKDDGFRIETDHGVIDARSLVMATGGLSIPKIGATGFAYEVARRFGLAVTEVRAGLVPLVFAGANAGWMPGLAGVSFEAVASIGRARFRERALFTHRGLSGPAILQISSYWREGGTVVLDLLPGQDAGDFLIARKAARPKAEVKTILAEVLPGRLAQHVAPGADGAIGDMPNRVLKEVGEAINRFAVLPSGTEGFAKAEVTVGGVDTAGLSSKTMEAREVPGLFVIGEAVDVTGWLGGYNFQWAWSSGYAAGMAV